MAGFWSALQLFTFLLYCLEKATAGDTGTLATTTTTSSPTTTNSQKSAFTASRCHSFDNTFTCDNGKCILDNERCDGTNDCGDSSDEDGCGVNVGLAVGLSLGLGLPVILVAVPLCVVFTVIYCRKFHKGRTPVQTDSVFLTRHTTTSHITPSVTTQSPNNGVMFPITTETTFGAPYPILAQTTESTRPSHGHEHQLQVMHENAELTLPVPPPSYNTAVSYLPSVPPYTTMDQSNPSTSQSPPPYSTTMD